MAWTEPRTWVTSELVTAAQLNTHVRDNMNEVFRAIERSNTVIDIVNTSVETNIGHFTIPANVMGASRGLRVTITGDALYNNADADGMALKMWVGSTQLVEMQGLFGLGLPSAAREGWRIVAEVWNLAANSQIGTLNYSNNSRSENSSMTSTTLGTADTTAAWTLDINADWTTASTNLSFRRRHCVVELI